MVDSGGGEQTFGPLKIWLLVAFALQHRLVEILWIEPGNCNPVGLHCPAPKIELLASRGTERAPRILLPDRGTTTEGAHVSLHTTRG
jgi:hypothetical protein